MMSSNRVIIGLVVCVGLALLGAVIVLVVSLIPLFFENKAVSTTRNQAKESDLITNTYALNLDMDSTDDTTITDKDSIARQLETVLGVSANAINIYSAEVSTSSRRRRRNLKSQLSKRQTFQCSARALSQTFTTLLITLKIVFPSSCGVSDACKKNFFTKAKNRMDAYTTSFPIILKFANGKTVNTRTMLCKSIVDSSSSSTASSTVTVSANASTTVTTTTSTTTTSTTTTYRNILFEQQALAETNADRATHCASALTLSDDLRTIAQAYAQQLCSTNTFAHSGNTYQGNYLGENLWAIGASYAMDINAINGSSPVGAWYDEVANYNFASPGFAANTGHFTQLVWQATTMFGIGICCIPDNTKCIVVANYYPGGNVGGAFPANVQASTCSGKK